MPEISKEIKLDLTDVPAGERDNVKRDVGDFVINEILRSVAGGNSPVQGEGKFKALNRNYAKDSKQGNNTANLQLTGEMLRTDLDFKLTPAGIRIEVKGNSEDRADGHNQLSSKAKNWANKIGFPKRRFIPDGRQGFTSAIKSGYRGIIEDAKVIEEEPEIEDTSPEPTPGTGAIPENDIRDTTSISFLLSDEAIEREIIRELKRRGR